VHANSIGAIVKRACRTAGYNAKEFAGHSLRAGLATQAAANGVPERLIMRQTRRRSVTTLRPHSKLVRPAPKVRKNPFKLHLDTRNIDHSHKQSIPELR
jgi:hypothetical protein